MFGLSNSPTTFDAMPTLGSTFGIENQLLFWIGLTGKLLLKFKYMYIWIFPNYIFIYIICIYIYAVEPP